MSFRFEDVAEIVKVIDSSSCDELLIETAEIKLTLRRRGAAPMPSGPGGPSAATVAAPAPGPGSAGTSPETSARTALPPVRQAAVPAAGGQSGGEIVAAPMVGMFYRSPSPETPPFVELGSVVRKGDPLCLIEVMKLFTTIAAPCDGRVLDIGAENGALVEYGQMLFVLDPSG